MSKTRVIKLTCPKCNEEFDYVYYESVNVTLNPKLKDKVLNSELFIAKCPKCGHEIVATHPIVYHDMEHKFMVHLGDYAHLLDLHEDFKDWDASKDFQLGVDNDVKLIGATSVGNLRNIIIAFDNNLDWRIVHIVLDYMKSTLIEYLNDNNLKIRDINYANLTGNKNEQGELEVEVDIGHGDEEELFYNHLPMDIYNFCLETFKERLDKVDPYVFDGNVASHFVSNFEEDYDLQEEHKAKYYFVVTDDDDMFICELASEKLEGLEVGKKVIFTTNYQDSVIGTLKRIVEYNCLNIVRSKENGGIIIDEYRNN